MKELQQDSFDFGEIDDALGLQHLRLDYWSQAAFEEVTGFEWISLMDANEIRNFKTNLKGRKIWVANHTIDNDCDADKNWSSAVVKTDKLIDVLLAIDEALNNHLSEREKFGGRNCFLEAMEFMSTTAERIHERLGLNGFFENEDDILIGLGS